MSNFNESIHARKSSGTSEGGQFTHKERPSNDGVGLTSDGSEAPLSYGQVSRYPVRSDGGSGAKVSRYPVRSL